MCRLQPRDYDRKFHRKFQMVMAGMAGNGVGEIHRECWWVLP